MDKITDVTVGSCESSNFIKPMRIHYCQSYRNIQLIVGGERPRGTLLHYFRHRVHPGRTTDLLQASWKNGKKKIWDALAVHDSVVIVVYNKTRDVLVFVKQFRPAVYANEANITIKENTGTTAIDHTQFPGTLGVTYELCAGLVDKNKSLPEIAQDELFEECGYKVPLENIQRVSGFRVNVGHSGARQEMFYAEVTDDMRVGPGGGNPMEGEFIEVVEIPAADGMEFTMDETKQKPVGLMFAVMWFYRNVYDNIKR